jgi:hypothetical protein
MCNCKNEPEQQERDGHSRHCNNGFIKVVEWRGDYPLNAFNAKGISFKVEDEYDMNTLLDEIKTEIEETNTATIKLKVKEMTRKKFRSLRELD